jgi:hypothetical protein
MIIIEIKKKHKLDLNNKIKNHKNFDKKTKKSKIKNQKKKDQIKISIIPIDETKIKNLYEGSN